MVLVPAWPPTSPQRLGYLYRCSRERLKPSSAFSLLLPRLRYFEEERFRKRNQLETERGREKGEEERRLRYVCSNIYIYTSYYSDTPRHKSSTVPLVTAQSVITRRYCGTSLLTGTSRSSLITAGCSADYTTTRRRIGTSCTGTKDPANTGAMLKKCFRILTSLQTGAAFSLLPSRLRYLEEGRHRKRNQLETEGERGEYTDKLLQIPNKSALPSANWFLSLPARLPTPKARIQAPVLNGDRGSV